MTSDSRNGFRPKTALSDCRSAGLFPGFREPGKSLWLVLALFLVCLMPSGQSLWIDEGFTVQYAYPQTISEFTARLDDESGSEALMPFGMVATWAGSKVFGHSERGLRAVSAVWAAVAVFLMWRVGVLVGYPWMPLMLACHPFVWHYAGEARPYAMVMAAASGLLYALTAAAYTDRDSTQGLWELLVFVPLMCGTYVFGVVPAAAVVVTFVGFKTPIIRRLAPIQWAGVAISSAATAGIGLFYLRAISRGLVDTSWDSGPWSVSLSKLAFSAYEILGFSGFGPGRYELRRLALEGGLGASLGGVMRPSFVGGIALFVVYCCVLAGLYSLLRSGPSPAARTTRSALFVVAVTAAATVTVFSISGFPVWGRHIAAVVPFVTLMVGLGAVSWGDARAGRRNGLAASLICLLLASSVFVRYHPQHQRDDYRSAATYAVSARADDLVVWWVGDRRVAEYYRVRFCDGPPAGRDCVVYATNMTAEQVLSMAEPDVVVMSGKPELHDREAVLRAHLDADEFQVIDHLMAFSVYRRAGLDWPRTAAGIDSEVVRK